MNRKNILFGCGAACGAAVAACAAFRCVKTVRILKDLNDPKAPQGDPSRKQIACVGDSITYGAGVLNTRAKDSYPAYLQKKLGDSVQVLNYGFGGRCAGGNSDYPYVKEKFYELSKDAKADCYILMLGTNDSKSFNWEEARYREDLAAFIDAYKNLGNKPRVIVMYPPKAFPYGKKNEVQFFIRNEIIEGKIHRIVADVTRMKNVETVDLFKLTEDHPEWFSDGVHPNALGNEKIADCLAKLF